MSVHSEERNEGKLRVFERAKQFSAYTLQITKNPKTFDPAQADGFTNEIRRLSIQIFSKIWAANNIVVRSARDWHERERLQKSACVDCNTLLPMIELSGPLFHLSTKRVKYWSGMCIEVRNRIRKWHESDKDRYDKVP